MGGWLSGSGSGKRKGVKRKMKAVAAQFHLLRHSHPMTSRFGGFTDGKQISVVTDLIIDLWNLTAKKGYITPYVVFTIMNHFNYKYSVIALDDSTTQVTLRHVRLLERKDILRLPMSFTANEDARVIR